MKLTGQCKTDFETWYKEQKDFWAIDLKAKRSGEWNTHTEVTFGHLSKSMQFGVYVDFFESFGFIIEIKHLKILWVSKYSSTLIKDDKLLYHGSNFDTREESRTDAINNVNEIYNVLNIEIEK